MCGIVGFIGNEQAAPILLDGLAHLEYRGYDSAGVAVISSEQKLQVRKAVGRLKVLSDEIHGGADIEGCIGLGHTRWATHGAPNIANSHPHVSENGKFAVIHNGIIENYVEIKEFLIGQGITFKSETDTEVVAQLLEFYYHECHDFLEAVGRVLRRNVEVVLASEFRYSDPIVDDQSLVIVISQSGETLDTMAALREAKKRGAYILSVVNVVGSSIARESDDVLYTWAGPEIAVATTKAYSTQLAVLDMIGLAFGEALGTVKKEEYDEAVAELQKLPKKMEQFLASESCKDIPKYAAQYFNHNSVFFIGRNLDYALGLEGSLKLKEISYIHSEAYASGELKHGTISLIEDGTLVIALGTYAPLFDKAMSNVVEVKARGADVLALATESHRGEMAKTVENVITIPDTAQMLLPSLGVVPLQLFSYYVALQRGCDIDKPRNLAKSVTVE